MKKTILFLFISILCKDIYSQNTLPTNIQSPNAASLGKYGDLPVSYHTGAVDISIPLYTLSSKGINLPINLDYDASGVKINTLPSWVGQNWVLNAGGAIIRTVQGLTPDEYKYVTDNPIEFNNYFQSYSTLSTIQNDVDKLMDSTLKYDLSPDMFTFNFMGKTGRFFLGNDGQWKVCSDHNIDVIFDINDDSNFGYPFIEDVPYSFKKMSKTIKGFKLRDDMGNTYVFGYNTNAIEYSIGFFNQSYAYDLKPLWTANCWYLTKVIDKYSNLIYELSYERGYFAAHFYNVSQYKHGVSKGWGGDSYTSPISNPHFNGDLISPVYLKTITDNINMINVNFVSKDSHEQPYAEYASIINPFINSSNPEFYYYLQTDNKVIEPYIFKPNGKVEILNPISGLKMRKLDNISIAPTNNGLYKVFNFEYNNDIFKLSERLNLTAIKEYNTAFYYSKKDGFLSSYKFAYKDFDKLPADYLSTASDHWGFYNGNPYSLPANLDDYLSFYKQREPNPVTLQYGMLQSITYPTGGTTTFEYEPHSYSKVLSLDRQSMENISGIAGGLRIKKIIDNDGKSVSKTRNFFYSKTEQGGSSGQLAAQPVYFWDKWEASPIDEDAKVWVQMFRTSSIIPLSNSFGTHIGYSSVIEEVPGEGKTIYNYSNFSDAFDRSSVRSLDSSLPSPNDMFSERGYMRGKLSKIQIYNNSNILKKEISYLYRADNLENNFILCSNLTPQFNSTSAAFNYYTGDIYKIFYPKYDVIKEIEKDFNAQDSVVNMKEYNKKDIELAFINEFNRNRKCNVRILESMKSISSDQSTVIVDYKYPFELQDPYMTEVSERFDIKEPIITRKYRNGISIGVQKTLFKKYDLYNFVVPSEYQTSSKSEKELETEITYGEYDKAGNLISFKKRNEPSQIIIRGYNNSYPLAIISNIKYEGEAMHNLDFSLVNAKYPSKEMLIQEFNKLRKLEPNMSIISYTYAPLCGITSITDPKGITTYYNYDNFYRLSEVVLGNKILKKIGYNYVYAP